MTPTGPLETKVAAFKVIARDALRMKLISPKLSTIASLQSTITGYQKEIATNDHLLVVLNYEVSKLDTNHPDYAVFQKNKTDNINAITTDSVNINKSIVEVQKQIDEKNTEIAKIESGETKVSLEDLNELVDKMVRENAYSQVKA